MSFSLDIRHEIKDRSGYLSELTGENGRPMECSHLYHGREIEEYNNPENGLYVTDIEHLAYHLLFVEKPSLIGLNKVENGRAIVSLYNRIEDYNRAFKLDFDLDYKIQRAKDFWALYLGLES